MRGHPRGCRRSVDRGTRGQSIEPRKVYGPGSRRCGEKRKATRDGAPWRVPLRPCVVGDLSHAWKPPAREPGDPLAGHRGTSTAMVRIGKVAPAVRFAWCRGGSRVTAATISTPGQSLTNSRGQYSMLPEDQLSASLDTIRTARSRTSGKNLFVVLLMVAAPLRSWSLQQSWAGSAAS